MGRLSLRREDSPADEWEYISSHLDVAFPAELSGVLYRYGILDLIDRNNSPDEVPRSQSFRRCLTQSPNAFVFIKFASADAINAEWDAAAQIPEAPYLHRPQDRSPLDQGIFSNKASALGPRFHFLVSPLIFGDDLFQILVDPYNRTERISRETLIDGFRQTIAGLALLHAKGIVHGDMKPENLMWDPTAGSVRIIAFDHSVVKGGRHAFGTTEYQAPEVSAGAAADPSQDIYSLGKTMLTLWGGKSVVIMDAEITNWPEDLNGGLAEIIRNMVKCDPQERSTTAEICCLMEIEQQELSAGGNV